MAQLLLKSSGGDAQRLRRAYDIALGRPPKPFETTLLLKALARYESEYRADPAAAKKLIQVGDAPQAMSEAAPDEAAWMIVCSTLMNTDEFLSQH
jgi:hypothetical protein